ncbi:hypothetical protein PB2503_09189 [Parvularcula bermudensis HTCC2503]|uniref:Porin n=1 Tax=Parvularcula bermudensis (strain ATCC BAA-594 / HTCC2503 / KCTC 12087) TaxID=314260 RepID=E0TCV2_PARBH|nr:DcaP family trimeric outer membrane transporter [Parvularcula bermudensis]ADM09891.1 hypothetical protein PB2503_09189 [Parvularcula bermudensis HTCC2503]
MKSILTALLASAAITPSLAFAQQDTEDLKARITALEAMVEDMKAALAAQTPAPTRPAVETLASAPRGATPPPAPGPQVRVGGFVDLDAHVSMLSDGAFASSSIARDFYIPGATPIGGDDQTVTDLTAEASRLFVEGQQTVGEREVKGYVEMDFLGSFQGNERVSNSYSPRLRRAFVSSGPWLVGQEWTTFQNTSAIPESASFLVLSDGMAFVRQPQIRYTAGKLQIALENGDTTITDIGGGRIEADSNALPDIIVRYNEKGAFGNISIAAIGRQLRADLPGFEEDDIGYGLSVSGRLNAGAKDDIRFNLFGGEGLGRYVGLNAVNGAAIDPVTGEIEAISSYGGLFAWRHPFAGSGRINLGVSGLWADHPPYIAGSATKSVQSAYGALLWDVADKTTVGTELLFGMRENEAGDDGTITRLTFSTKYAF